MAVEELAPRRANRPMVRGHESLRAGLRLAAPWKPAFLPGSLEEYRSNGKRTSVKGLPPLQAAGNDNRRGCFVSQPDADVVGSASRTSYSRRALALAVAYATVPFFMTEPEPRRVVEFPAGEEPSMIHGLVPHFSEGSSSSERLAASLSGTQ